jgi:hypothetical protein
LVEVLVEWVLLVQAPKPQLAVVLVAVLEVMAMVLEHQLQEQVVKATLVDWGLLFLVLLILLVEVVAVRVQ